MELPLNRRQGLSGVAASGASLRWRLGVGADPARKEQEALPERGSPVPYSGVSRRKWSVGE